MSLIQSYWSFGRPGTILYINFLSKASSLYLKMKIEVPTVGEWQIYNPILFLLGSFSYILLTPINIKYENEIFFLVCFLM